MFSFYWSCLKSAFSSGIKPLEYGFSLLAILIDAVDYFVEFPAALKAIMDEFSAPAFVIIIAVVVLIRLVRAPFQLYETERLAKEVSENARLPALEVSLPTPPVVNSISLSGNTSESLAGNRQTVISCFENDVVALVVKNCGDFIASQCQARVLSITLRLPNEDQALEIVESINIPWIKEDPEGSHVIDIPPNDKRRIWLGGVRQHGHFWLFRDIKALPIEYQQLLGAAGMYEVILQIDGANIPPQHVRLEIVTSEGPKVENGFQRGKVSVRILANENLLTA